VIMSTTLVFRFPGGRYHATPWGNHVNEGLIEWPPSPWRLTRAVIATAFAKCNAPDPVPAGHALRTLVDALASAPPVYRIPRSCVATHSRHYMPKTDGKTTLVLDACAVVGSQELAVSWPVELAPDCRELLQAVAGSIAYLGRAESWVEARLLPQDAELPPGETVVPHVSGMAKGPGWEQVALLSPQPASEYDQWRTAAVEDALSDLPLPEQGKPSKKLCKDRESRQEPYPTDLFACLTRDTAWLQARGWNQPPGSRRLLYWRRTDALSVAVPAPVGRVRNAPAVEAVLLALASHTRRGDVLPLFSRCLPQAELLHRALVSSVGNGMRVDCPVLTGRDADGQPLAGHRHLHIIPLSLDASGRLDHFVLWSPMGLDAQAQHAICGLRRTWTKGSDKALFLSVAGIGSMKDISAVVGTGVMGPSRAWVSHTPFVPPRHLKASGKNSIEGQVLSELASRGLPGAAVELLDREEWVNQGFHRFVRSRRDQAKAPPQDIGLALRLVFPEPISGPICLGYASHFGLGLFEAEG